MMGEKIKSYLKRYGFYFVISFLLLVSIVLGIINISRLSKRKAQVKAQGNAVQNIYEPLAYNSPCPDFSRKTLDGRNIILSQYKGSIIVLVFSRFYLSDLSNLLYLEHVAKYHKKDKVNLILVNTLGKHDAESINKFVTLASPIIEDDGSIAALFGARQDAVVIIDGEFRIKYINDKFEKESFYNQLLIYLFGNKAPQKGLSDIEISRLFKLVFYKNSLTGELEPLEKTGEERKTIVNLIISSCLECRDRSRFILIKELSDRLLNKKVKIVILFASGNEMNMLRDVADKTEMNSANVTMGVIDKSSLPEEEYYRLFNYMIDPRIFVLDEKGGIVASETRKNRNKINNEYLLSIIGAQ